MKIAKETLRGLIDAERQQRSDAARQGAARGLRDVFLELPQVQHAHRVWLYVSRPEELGTGLLRAALAARGVCVLLPVITSAGEVTWTPDMAFPDARADSQVRLQATGSGAPPPLAEGAIVVVPALAVDNLGHRLGRSERYDRALRLVGPIQLVLAAVHDSEVFDAAVEPVPTELHNLWVDAAITPSRILFFPHDAARTHETEVEGSGSVAVTAVGFAG
jgi:5-formyltetrahydrofolate cyclo-ligase